MESINFTAPLPVDEAAKKFVWSHPHLLTWNDEGVDLWRFTDSSTDLRFVATLSENIRWPGPPGRNPSVVIDEERDILVLPGIDPEDESPCFKVFSLSDGQLLRNCALYGTLAESPVLYSNGHVLAHLHEGETHLAPDGRWNIVLCDVAGDEWLLSGINLPERLAERDKERANAHNLFAPMLFRDNGDVIVLSNVCGTKSTDVMLYRGPLQEEQQPDVSIELKSHFDEPGLVWTYRCTPTVDESFVLCTYEDDAQATANKFEGCTTIRAINAETMDIQWTAEPVWGMAHSVQYVPSADIVLVIGGRNVAEEREWEEWTTFVGAIDAKTGALRTLDVVNHTKQGTNVAKAALSADAEDPKLAIVFMNGDVSVISLDVFLQHGFERDGERVRVARAFVNGSHVQWAAVERQSIIGMVVSDEPVPRTQVQCVDW